MNLSEADKKQIKIIGGITVAGLLVYLIFGNKTESSTDPTGNSGYIPDSPIFSAKNVAITLFDAMNKLGTDTDVIMETLKTVSQAQFAQVIEAFGKRNYNELTGNQYNLNPFVTLPKLGLKDWLKEELSAKDYAILKLKYPYAL
jgi:hypothetical protein